MVIVSSASSCGCGSESTSAPSTASSSIPSRSSTSATAVSVATSKSSGTSSSAPSPRVRDLGLGEVAGQLRLLIERPAAEVVVHPRRVGVVRVPVVTHRADATGHRLFVRHRRCGCDTLGDNHRQTCRRPTRGGAPCRCSPRWTRSATRGSSSRSGPPPPVGASLAELERAARSSVGTPVARRCNRSGCRDVLVPGPEDASPGLTPDVTSPLSPPHHLCTPSLHTNRGMSTSCSTNCPTSLTASPSDRVEERMRQPDTGRPLHGGQRRGSREHHRSR